jgi:multicomponent Na+:H+ antiporter subunit E
MVRIVGLVAALCVFWILMSGFFAPFLLAAGLGSALFVAWLAHRMDLIDREGHPIHLTWSALTYWPWLIKEILKSAVDVARIILDPKLPVSPTVVRFKPRQKTTVGLVTHANSITLTPGTLSIEVGREEFMVHALTREGAAAAANSDMDRRVERFEGSAPEGTGSGS